MFSFNILEFHLRCSRTLYTEIVRLFANWPGYQRYQRYVLIWRNIDTNWVSEYESSLSPPYAMQVYSSVQFILQSRSQPLMYSLLYTDLTPTCSLFRCLHYTIPLVTHNCLNVLTLPCFAKMSSSNEVSSVLRPGFYLVISTLHSPGFIISDWNLLMRVKTTIGESWAG